ncbi:MAG: hypothetical protein HXY51_08370 [Nitrospirae bacterium]|nr:hypothetical protein [Nitrospirota bacterium]
MRNEKSGRYTTESEDEEMESEKVSRDLFERLKADQRRAQKFKPLGKISGRREDEDTEQELLAQAKEAGLDTKGLGEEAAERNNTVMQKHGRRIKQSSRFRKAA